MISPRQQVIDKCKEVFALAERLYSVDTARVQVTFDLRGGSAGMARYRGGIYTVRFNADLLLRKLEEIKQSVIPHEIAHIVCHMKRLGFHHDDGWRRMDRALGGTGETCHEMEVVKGNGTTYEYITDRGHKVRIGDKHHRRVQGGQPLEYRRIGTVNQHCAYSIVGVRGRTLAEPIVKKAVATIPEPKPVMSPESRQWIQTHVHVGDLHPTPHAPIPLQRIAPPVQRVDAGQSKAAVSRNIMSAGYRASKAYETIIAEMMTANGYNRQLARATFKANAARVNIPNSFGG